MKKTDRPIKFLVMDKDEYEFNKMNLSIAKSAHSPNLIDTAKLIH